MKTIERLFVMSASQFSQSTIHKFNNHGPIVIQVISPDVALPKFPMHFTNFRVEHGFVIADFVCCAATERTLKDYLNRGFTIFNRYDQSEEGLPRFITLRCQKKYEGQLNILDAFNSYAFFALHSDQQKQLIDKLCRSQNEREMILNGIEDFSNWIIYINGDGRPRFDQVGSPLYNMVDAGRLLKALDIEPKQLSDDISGMTFDEIKTKMAELVAERKHHTERANEISLQLKSMASQIEAITKDITV